MTLSNSWSSVKLGKHLSEPIDTVRGFRQGDRLSCDLFNFLLESVYSCLHTPTTLTSLGARCEMSSLRLRKIFGPVRVGDDYRIRTNRQLYELFNGVDVAKRISTQRLYLRFSDTSL